MLCAVSSVPTKTGAVEPASSDEKQNYLQSLNQRHRKVPMEPDEKARPQRNLQMIRPIRMFLSFRSR